MVSIKTLVFGKYYNNLIQEKPKKCNVLTKIIKEIEETKAEVDNIIKNNGFNKK